MSARCMGRRPSRIACDLARAIVVLTLLGVGAHDVKAQGTGTVSGTVTNVTTGTPVAGAQISIVGTTLGTLTGNVGDYTIANVPAGQHTVRVEFIGFGAVEEQIAVQAGATVTADFELRTEAISLDAVVVTGTAGQARRREIGNSISQISTQQIELAAVADVADVLQGRVSGLTIMDNSGQIGTGSSIRLRGNSSINMSNTPLIYVDGVRIEKSPTGSDGEVGQSPIALDILNPNDIERIEVIKGPAATTLYGTEASSGVIQIFTKRGAPGAPAWNASIDQGFHRMPHVGPSSDVNPTGLNLNDCTHEPGCPASGSWFRDGHIQRYNLSVRGGGDQANYFASGHWGRQNGVVDPQHLTEYSVRANLSFRPLENLQINFNNLYSRRNIQWIPDGNNADGFLLNVLRGDKGYTPENDDALLLLMDLLQEINHYTTGMQMTWNPIPAISQRLNVGLDYETSDLQDYKPWGYYSALEGDREDDQQQDRNLTLDYTGSWAADLGAISSSFSWGGQMYDEYSYGLNGFDSRFAGPGDQLLGDGTIRDVDEGRTRVRSGGFFVQEMVGWRDRLFITGGIRWDGFSTFGDDFGLATYPKISAAYTVSDEDFFPAALGTMKLRAAYGVSGKAPSVFDAARIYEATAGDEAQPAVILANFGNPDLGPERSEEVEFGLEGGLFDGRVFYEFTRYDQTTNEALICISEAPSLGTEECTLRNLGRVSNKGTEFMVSVVPLRGETLEWEVTGRYGTNNNRIEDLGGLEDLGNAYQVGLPLPAVFDDRVMNPDAVGELPVYEDQFIGPNYPTDTYSLSTRVTFLRRLTLDLLGEGQSGHWLANGPGYQNMRRRAWPPCYAIQEMIDNGETAQLTAGQRATCDPNRSDQGVHTHPADFFKLRSATIAYQLPDGLVPLATSATLRLQARNLFTITDYPGLDPESEDGGAGGTFRNEYYNLPSPRSFILNLTVNF